MELSDSRPIAASADIVFKAITSAEVLQACVPGCKDLTGTAEEGFEATVVQKVGPVKATFKGQVVLSDMLAPESLTLTGEGKGGAAGFAKGGAHVRIEPSDEGVMLHYTFDAKVGGKLAQLGSRIIDGFAKKMADQFFTNLQEHIEGPQEIDSDVDEDPQGSDEGHSKKGWLKKLVS
ncbi:MAG: carbon monoxide dehydrogenase subunit G [Marinovum sp.]|nr:carbon monoxide dehydrogenase subunit G [Marinovum sp.]